MSLRKKQRKKTDQKTKSIERRPVIAGFFRQWQALFCVSEKRTAIAIGDVCKGLGSLPTSGLGCDHLQALLATIAFPTDSYFFFRVFSREIQRYLIKYIPIMLKAK